MCELKILVAKAESGPISFFKLVNVSMDEVKLLIATIVEVKKDSVANTLELYLGCVVKFHSPFAETKPPNAAFPTTLMLPMDALVMFAKLIFTTGTLVLIIVASPMLAFGMVAFPVNVGLFIGAFSKFNEASALIRSVISWLITDVKLAKCGTMLELVELPMTMSVISVL